MDEASNSVPRRRSSLGQRSHCLPSSPAWPKACARDPRPETVGAVAAGASMPRSSPSPVPGSPALHPAPALRTRENTPFLPHPSQRRSFLRNIHTLPTGTLHTRRGRGRGRGGERGPQGRTLLSSQAQRSGATDASLLSCAAGRSLWDACWWGFHPGLGRRDSLRHGVQGAEATATMFYKLKSR